MDLKNGSAWWCREGYGAKLRLREWSEFGRIEEEDGKSHRYKTVSRRALPLQLNMLLGQLVTRVSDVLAFVDWVRQETTWEPIVFFMDAFFLSPL